ncbi:MAG: hypothetical protein KatS3mg044_0727 [Rhodothermaceae bacterium]|nr:MAG: hypothetical protein KatS3mg044_0727 [Rhodothermaceae bacterium]
MERGLKVRVMEKIICKTCASESMVPMEVLVQGEEPDLKGGEQESFFYTCHVCGDNWLTIKEKSQDGTCQITHIYQMGMTPLLKRVAQLDGPVSDEEQVSEWAYFMGDDEITEDVWEEKLRSRRSILRSICTN